LRSTNETVGCDDLSRTQHSLIPGDVIGQHWQQRSGHAALQTGACCIDETRRLRARSAEVEAKAPTALEHPQVDLVEPVRLAVMLEEVDGAKFAIGQLAQAFLDPLLRHFDHSLHHRRQRPRAITGDEFRDAFARHVDRCNEGPEIKIQLRRQASRREDHLEDVLAHAASFDEPYAWNAQPFLPGVARVGRPAGEVHASNVGDMRLHPGPGEDLSVGIDRAGQLYVVLVERSDERIIAAEHVAVPRLQCGSCANRPNQVSDHGSLERNLEAHRGEGAIRQK